MASSHTRPNSNQQQLSQILPGGRRVARSLHTTDPLLASQIAEKTQTLVDALTGPEKARQTVLKVLVEDIFIAAQVPNPWDVEKEAEETPIFLEFAKEFIARKTCTQKAKDFMASNCLDFSQTFGSWHQLIGYFTGTDCQTWYDNMSVGITGATAKNRLMAVSSVFAQAVKLGVINRNPCAGLQVKDAEESDKEELSDEEVEKVLEWLKIESLSLNLKKSGRALAWTTAVLLARYAGCRLADAVGMASDSVIDGALVFTARKTKEVVTVPMVPVLKNHIDGLLALQVTTFCRVLKETSLNYLSNEFGNILEQAGIDTGKKEVNGRMRRTKTFHSLRASFCSWLAKANVPEDLRMLLAGHVSAKVNRHYTHQTAEDIAKRLAPFLAKEEVA